MQKLKVLDLFSGIGGFSLGLERTGGFETVAFCEIEPFPRKVLAKHWPKVPCYHDVRTLTKDILDRDGIAVDVICGGFPCQDISTAGKGVGIAGERSSLWKEYARLIGELRPRYVIVENVAALLGRGLATLLGDLATLGYDAEWHCIPAVALGAPHERDRIWIIAHPEEKSGLHEPHAWEISKRLPDYRSAWLPGTWPAAAPKLCRMDDGIPDRVERTEVCGNAVIPQIPELIGNAILQSMKAEGISV